MLCFPFLCSAWRNTWFAARQSQADELVALLFLSTSPLMQGMRVSSDKSLWLSQEHHLTWRKGWGAEAKSRTREPTLPSPSSQILLAVSDDCQHSLANPSSDLSTRIYDIRTFNGYIIASQTDTLQTRDFQKRSVGSQGVMPYRTEIVSIEVS